MKYNYLYKYLVVLLTKIFDDGWAFGSRAKGRFREGAFPICCLENRYELFKLLPKRENYDANLFNIDRYSSIRLCKSNYLKNDKIIIYILYIYQFFFFFFFFYNLFFNFLLILIIFFFFFFFFLLLLL